MFWYEPGPQSEYTLSFPVVMLTLEKYEGNAGSKKYCFSGFAILD